MPKLRKGQVAFPPPRMNTCHDIRKWTACSVCGAIGHRDNMVQSSPDVFWHGRCFVKRFGIERLLEMPRKETTKLSLGDLGLDLMRALVSGISAQTENAKATDGTEGR